MKLQTKEWLPLMQPGKAPPRICSGTFLKGALHVDEWLQWEHSREMKECAADLVTGKKHHVPKTQRYFCEAEVLGGGRGERAELKDCSKRSWWESLGFALQPRRGGEAVTRAQGPALEEKAASFQRGAADTQDAEQTSYGTDWDKLGAGIELISNDEYKVPDSL